MPRKIEDRYQAALASIPAPGTGCHPYLLSVANLAVMAGRTDDEALAEIRAAIPQGDRIVDDREITDTIEKARQDTTPFSHGRASRRRVTPARRTVSEIRATVVGGEINAEKLRSAVIEAGGGALDPFGVEVRESSPVRLESYSEACPYAGGMIPLLRHLYRPDDVVFIGRQYDAARENLKPAAEWAAYFEDRLARISKLPPESQQSEFERLGAMYPLIMPNPLTGCVGQTKKGEPSFRADSCVGEYRYIIAEFDKMTFAEQGAILRGVGKAGVKIAAVIYSGGKSCHAWLCCEGVTTADEWETQVKNGIFPVLTKLGVDPACKNPSHLSRLPGVFRGDKKNWQRLLYLAPEGGAL